MRAAFKLHKSFLMITTLLVLNINFAQTKEETVSYINDIVKMSKGVGSINGERQHYVTDQIFGLDFVYCKGRYDDLSSKSYYDIKYYDIPWVTMSENIEINKERELYEITIKFSGKFNYKMNFDGVNKDGSVGIISIYVLPSKEESVKRALLHLKKLSEVKDLFGN